MDVPNQKLEKAILTVISIGFVIWSAAFIYNSSFIAVDGKRYFCLFDDAMISMRYAWNFSHGLGLVWNQGEYVQGYTSLLMTLLMSFATLIFDKSNAVLFIQILGVGFMLAIAYVTMQISDSILQINDHSHQALVRVLVFFWSLFYYPLAYWSLMGMETGLLTLLLLLGVLFSFHYVRSQNTTLLFLNSACFSLAFLTRNDSIFVALLVWAYIAWETCIPLSKANLRGLTRLFGAISIFLFFVVGQLAFQYSYYGKFLPNTYTLKLTGMPLLIRAINGIEFVIPFLVSSASILILASLEVISNFQKRKLLLISIVFTIIGYQIYVGGDAWNYWRMITPAMPFLTVLFIVTINALVIAVSATQAFRVYFLRSPIFPQKYLVQILAVFLTAIGLLSVNVPFLREITFINKPYTWFSNQVNVNIAIVLNELTTPEATIGVFWAGTVPYFSDRKATDFFGKADSYIAQLPPDLSGKVSWLGMSSRPGHNKYDLDYSIKTLKPTYVQGFKWGRQDLSQLIQTKYVQVEYDGITLFFHRDSPFVLWNKLNIP
jgi:hypothetical protein